MHMEVKTVNMITASPKLISSALIALVLIKITMVSGSEEIRDRQLKNCLSNMTVC